MRLIRTLVPDADLEATLDVLDSDDIDYVLFAEESEPDDRVLVEFPLPTQAVETVIEAVRAAGGDVETSTVVASGESGFSEHIDEMDSRFITGCEEDDAIATEDPGGSAERVGAMGDRVEGEWVGPSGGGVGTVEAPTVRTEDRNRLFGPEPAGLASGTLGQPFTGPT